MGRGLVIIRHSARKHGVDDDDIRTAVDAPLLLGPLDDDHPQRLLLHGFDARARVLELVLLVHDNGTREVIHAMKARKKYLDLL